VLFSFEPNLRAFTDGTQRLLRNAVLGPAPGAAETERLLRGYGARFETRRSGGQVRFLVANPRGLAADEHPFATDLARRLRERGPPVRAFSLREAGTAASAGGARLAA
jgi:hypothetical protein